MSLNVRLVNDVCLCCGRGDEVYSSDVTHNLSLMALKAGLYEILWKPEENGITNAKQAIEPMIMAIKDMKNRPDYFKKFNPKNGFGDYDNFIVWLDEYLKACVSYPKAHINVSA